MKRKALMNIMACCLCIVIAAGCSNVVGMTGTDRTAASETDAAENAAGTDSLYASGYAGDASGTGSMKETDDEGAGAGFISADEALESVDEVIDLDEETGTVDITKGGTYLVKGSSDDCSLVIDVPDDESVTLILEDAEIVSRSSAAIYTRSAKEVIIVLSGESSLSNGGSFSASDSDEISAVIDSCDDLYISGDGKLKISSPAGKGISGNDSLVISGGELIIDAEDDGINVNEDFVLTGGLLTITAGDDAIHADALLQIDGGAIDADAAEGLEATAVIINDGDISISASDDGINAAQKTEDMDVCVTINGGNLTIVMGQGDTDGIDSNGDLIINGGYIDITGQSACDYDGKAELNGGTLIINGEEVSQITNQFMGGPGEMGAPGEMGGFSGMGNPGEMGPMQGAGGEFQRPEDGGFMQGFENGSGGGFPERPDGTFPGR
ncbi:MAG: carbohydrate-binding domain-containing protein [Lachnospiraceae bacterium]|nr:carbohydrate-binding domain-containing protein [Lachnospiraceae bacterium]